MPLTQSLSVKALNSAATTVKTQALIVGVTSTDSGPKLLASPFAAKVNSALESTLVALGATGSVDNVLTIPSPEGTAASVVVLTGVGKTSTGAENESLRRAAGAAVRGLKGVSSAVLALPTDDAGQLAAVVEGALMGAYRYQARKQSPKDEVALTSLSVITAVAARTANATIKRATSVANAVNDARTLINEPPNLFYPETFATAAKDLCKGLPVKVTVFDDKRLEKEGFGGIIGVGKGSTRPPRLVKVEYTPAKAKKHLALVGKGITFDTGGISLKPPMGMTTMKSDMGGAAAILTATLAIAELGLPVRTTAWLCIAENMPSGSAGRPEDVITIFGGKTVEVLNTDAEGRLVMADGLAAASAEQPDVILDVATLTGAQVVALGTRYAAVMGDEQVRHDIVAAGEAAGEPFWPMPLPEEIKAGLQTPNADIANVTGSRDGGMLAAGLFLQEFVGTRGTTGELIPWGHLDIAGPSFNEGAPHGYTPKQGTGSAVRTVIGFAETLSGKK